MWIFDDSRDAGGVRSKLPDGSGPDRTPPTPEPPTVGTALVSHHPMPVDYAVLALLRLKLEIAARAKTTKHKQSCAADWHGLHNVPPAGMTIPNPPYVSDNRGSPAAGDTTLGAERLRPRVGFGMRSPPARCA
jgi:hypothetical protein